MTKHKKLSFVETLKAFGMVATGDERAGSGRKLPGVSRQL